MVTQSSYNSLLFSVSISLSKNKVFYTTMSTSCGPRGGLFTASCTTKYRKECHISMSNDVLKLSFMKHWPLTLTKMPCREVERGIHAHSRKEWQVECCLDSAEKEFCSNRP